MGVQSHCEMATPEPAARPFEPSASGSLTMDDCKSFLQTPSGDGSGGTVFDHLAEVLLRLCEERPANPVDVFEQVSAAVKQTRFHAQSAPLRAAFEDHPSVEWARCTTDKFIVRGPGEPGACTVQACAMQNIVKDAILLEQAGIGLKAYEATRIALSLHRLASDQPLKSVRYWGCITGTQSDYSIAECQFKEGHTGTQPEKSLSPDSIEPEPYGQGANSFVYFVRVGDEWKLLPHVRPEWIMAARGICKLFTGDLTAPVYSWPPFPGNEAAYLRAAVCRISLGSTMAVDGMFSIEEDEDTGASVVRLKDSAFGVEKAEAPYEAVASGEEGLTQPEEWLNKWVHNPRYPGLLKTMGRCSWPKPPPVPEGEDEPEEDENKEENVPLNTNLTEELPVGALAAWSVRLAVPVLKDLSPAVLRSLRWPGAFCVVSGDQMANIYMGDGLKYTGERFQSAMPPGLQEECSDLMPSEEGSDEPGAGRVGMKEQADELLPNSFNDVDQTAEEGEEEEEEDA